MGLFSLSTIRRNSLSASNVFGVRWLDTAFIRRGLTRLGITFTDFGVRWLDTAFLRRGLTRRGITLIEVMVVLTIIAAMTTVAMPTMKGFYRKSQLKTEVREFIGAARYARQAAILRNSTTEIWIDFDKDTYQLMLAPNNKSEYRFNNKDVSDAMEQIHELNNSKKKLFFKTVESATKADRDKYIKIRFFKNGSASASTIVIASAERKGEITIEITGATGAVRTYAGSPKGSVETQDGTLAESGRVTK